MPYMFLGINSKLSLSTNRRDITEIHVKKNDDFFDKIRARIINKILN